MFVLRAGVAKTAAAALCGRKVLAREHSDARICAAFLFVVDL